ncbi:transcriptional regulator GcvA [Azospirillum melinis]
MLIRRVDTGVAQPSEKDRPNRNPLVSRHFSLARLPPLPALRTFLIAAQHASFTQAAQELNVTPAAVGQQIRLLEAHLGTSLFHRHTRGMSLTEHGNALLPGLQDGFEQILHSLDALMAEGRRSPLTVSVPPSFATKWLVPRLQRYVASHPGQSVRILSSMAVADLTADGIDCAIRFGPGNYPGVVAEPLLTETVIAVCSPDLLDAASPPHRLEDLRHHILLHDDSPDGDPTCPDWRMWLRAAGIGDPACLGDLHFDQSSLVLEAAVAGQGIALAKARLAEADIAAGRLIRLFGDSRRIHFAYHFLSLPHKAADPDVIAFRDWLRTEAAAG